MLDKALLMLVRGGTGLPFDHGGRVRPVEERLQDPADARRAARQRLRDLASSQHPRTTRFNPGAQGGTLAPTT
ncbi:MAG: hypothetical protein HQ481_07875 [Alphaproteobacteria bacterium]|nr:hypothetical protein [Alphaproteobacteria bacterium]